MLWTLLVAVAVLALPRDAAAQAAVMPVPRQVFLDNNGNPCSGCKVYTYDAGTTTARFVYSDPSLSTTLPNPFTLNASGRPQTSGGTETNVYPAATSYKWELRTSADVVIWTADNVAHVPAAAGNVDLSDQTAGEALAAGDVVYLSDGSGGGNVGQWYKADADNTYSSSTAGMVGMVPSAIASGGTGTIRLAGRVTGLSGLTAGELYYASATAGALTATPPTNARQIGEAQSTTVLILHSNPGALRVPDSDGTHSLVVATTSNLTADRLLTLVPGDGARSLTIGADSTINQDVSTTGSPTFSDITFSGGDLIASANAVFRRNTSDASDNGFVQMAGGGSASETRGAYITAYGNEHGSTGRIHYQLGNVSGAVHQFSRADGSNLLLLDGSDGAATFNSTRTGVQGTWFFLNSSTGSASPGMVIRSGRSASDDYALLVTSGDSGREPLSALSSGKVLMPYTGASLTTGSAANMFIDSGTGQVFRSTSSARYKTNIRLAPTTAWRWLLNLNTHYYQGESDGTREFGGLLAEEVVTHGPRGADGYPLYASLDAQGQPDWVQYPHLTAPLIDGLKNHEDRLNKQNDVIDLLLQRMERLERENAELRARLGQLSPAGTLIPNTNGAVVLVPAVVR
ncbi:MAG TPA: hypothetical protein VEA16_08380 [Vicinamibacterales bacterium]|nr:hypothetical protein [Vicinamibacterales bacterium]